MYDYEKFHRDYPADIHDDAGRHGFVAGLCRGVVYDLGCGSGTLADYFPGQYLGLDIAASAIERAKRVRRASAMFERKDCTNMHNEDFSRADTIVLSEFLEHIENDEQIFTAIKRTARKGTRIIITVPNGPRIRCDEHVREFTIPQLRAKLAPFGRVKFYNWRGEKKQIICSCDIGEPERADLSLVMIVKDEEKGLETAIMSAIEHCDEIIVAVDKSSTDKTLAIATMYADCVKEFEWQDDFANARNNAQKGAMCKWILFLDGHEKIKTCIDLSEKLRSSAGGLMCTIQMENGFEFHNPRIYKNGLKFQGAVHEKQNCGQVEFFPQFVIQHDRLGAQSDEAAAARQAQRDDMVPRIMGAQYKENKANTRATFHLGMHYIGRGKLAEARMWFRRYLKYSKVKGERWFVYFHMAMGYLAEDKLFRAFWYINKADNEQPGRWEINKLKGMIFFACRHYARAIEAFVNTFYQNKGYMDYKPFVRDDAGTWNSVGECFFRLGNYEKAQLAFGAAADQCKDEKLKKFFQARADMMIKLLKVE